MLKKYTPKSSLDLYPFQTFLWVFGSPSHLLFFVSGGIKVIYLNTVTLKAGLKLE